MACAYIYKVCIDVRGRSQIHPVRGRCLLALIWPRAPVVRVLFKHQDLTQTNYSPSSARRRCCLLFQPGAVILSVRAGHSSAHELGLYFSSRYSCNLFIMKYILQAFIVLIAASLAFSTPVSMSSEEGPSTSMTEALANDPVHQHVHLHLHMKDEEPGHHHHHHHHGTSHHEEDLDDLDDFDDFGDLDDLELRSLDMDDYDLLARDLDNEDLLSRDLDEAEAQ